jgi:hypothetical protein
MDRDFFKSAIAEAKTVRESAIANAKAALEEAFEPKMRSMLAAKLEEMEEMDEEATYEGKKEDYKMEEEVEVEELDLDEILAELEGELSEEDSEGMLKEEESIEEEEEMETEEDKMDSEEEVEMDSEDEDIDLEDMTEDELKKFIEDVIEDMVQAGELEAGDNAEEEMEDEMDSEEDDMEIEMEDDMEDEEELNELFGIGKKSKVEDEIKAQAKKEWEDSDKSDAKKKSIQLDMIKKLRKANLDSSPSAMADIRREIGMEKDERSMLQKVATGASGGRSKVTSEAVETINILKAELHEINLLNSKLLYTNKIFKAKNLKESQKVKVLNAFDKAATVKEAKLIFETLNENFKTEKTVKRSIKETKLGSASKSIAKPNTSKQPIVESNEMVKRFQKLAGII